MTSRGMVKPVVSAALDLVQRPPMREVIPIEPGSSFRYYLHDDPHPFVTWGYHPEFEVHLAVSTSGRYVIGDVIDVFDPGQLVLVGPNLPHHWMSDLDPHQMVPDSHAVLHFTGEWIEQCQEVMPEFAALDTLLPLSAHGIEFLGDTARAGAQALLAIGQAADRFEQVVRVLDLLRLLAGAARDEFRLIVRDWSPQIDTPEAVRLVGEAIDYILEHLGDDIRLSEVARLAAMSESAFSRYFKAASGQTFTDMVRQLRLTRARQLLERTDDRVASIALSVGYTNLSNFNRQFLRSYGLTPRDYRRQTREGVLALPFAASQAPPASGSTASDPREQ